jgi:hypothetical protein
MALKQQETIALAPISMVAFTLYFLKSVNEQFDSTFWCHVKPASRQPTAAVVMYPS